jgi:putative peptidoglycan lipid II flippase
MVPAVIRRPRTQWSIRGVAGAAIVVAAVTLLARAVGFGRSLVFAHTVGSTCLGTAYVTANTVPNIVFEVVAGGALAGMVVPVVAGAIGRGDLDAASKIVSVLLTWALLGGAVVATVGVAVSGPLMRLLLASPSGCNDTDLATVGTHMLVIFWPQVMAYSVAVVAAGALQAQRRFLAAAIAPLLSSVVVMSCYVIFGQLFGSGTDSPSRGNLNDIGSVPLSGQLILSAGTTAGVVALAALSVLAMFRTKLRIRLALRLPSGTARPVRRLAVAGLLGLLAQQLAVVVVVLLANGSGERGAVVLYNYAWAAFLVPYAALSLPVIGGAFTVASERYGRGDTAGYRSVASRSGSGVVLLSWLGAAALVGSAFPLAHLFVGAQFDDDHVKRFGWALVAFAPALVGFGVASHGSRLLYARGSAHAGGAGIAIGWLITAAVDAFGVTVVDSSWLVAVLGGGLFVGMTVSAAVVTGTLIHLEGRSVATGWLRAHGAGACGALGGGLCGGAVGFLLPRGSWWLTATTTVGAAVLSVLLGAGICWGTDRSGVSAALALVTRRG